MFVSNCVLVFTHAPTFWRETECVYWVIDMFGVFTGIVVLVGGPLNRTTVHIRDGVCYSFSWERKRRKKDSFTEARRVKQIFYFSVLCGFAPKRGYGKSRIKKINKLVGCESRFELCFTGPFHLIIFNMQMCFFFCGRNYSALQC